MIRDDNVYGSAEEDYSTDVLARKAVWTNSEGLRVGVQVWLVENFGRIFDSTLEFEQEDGKTWYVVAKIHAKRIE